MRNILVVMLAVSACRTCICADVDAPALTGSFNSAGVNIAYELYGEGAPVVTVHGLTGHKKHLRVLRRLLLEAGYRVITFDIRGHGESGKPRGAGDYGTAMADDVARLLDHLSVDRTHIVGYSMGGDIANKFRERHSDRLLSFVMGGVGLGVTEGWTKDPFDFADLAKSLKRGTGFSPLLEQPGAIHPGVASKEEVSEVNDWMMKGQDALALAAIIQSYSNLEVDHSKLKKNTVPTLIIVGEKDAERPSAVKLHAVLANSELCIVDGVNHFGATRNQDFVESVVGFIKAHDKKGK